MVTNVLNQKVLVLNKNWQVVNVSNAFDAICDVYVDRAQVVDANYGLHDYDSWVQNWEDLHDISTIDKMKIICTSQVKFMIPEVIRFKHATRYNDWSVKFSRKNIFRRDGQQCQYCGKKEANREKLNLDHIVPKSRGGRTNWKNIVVSCIPCNSRKADRTPAEAGMKLLKQPVTPKWTDDKKILPTKIPKSWDAFVGHLYWSTELED
jgi:5-methylcytosine-specific restriction endonuclease McrA